MSSNKNLFNLSFFTFILVLGLGLKSYSKIKPESSNGNGILNKKTNVTINQNSSESDDSKKITSRSNINKKKRKLFLNFANSKNRLLKKESNQDSNESLNTNSTASTSSIPTSDDKPKQGFESSIQLGYSNSAYRYSGEEYPAKSIDFAFAPTYTTTCFSLNCIYAIKILGGIDLNKHEKTEFGLIQFGIKFPGDPWGGYLAPGISFAGYLPATPKEINDDHMLYGFGSAFSLATTPELMGTKVISFKGSVSVRKNIHEGELIKQQDWVTKQALATEINFTEKLSAKILFSHILSVNYNKSETEIIEQIQTLAWQSTDWLSLEIGHSNTGPIFSPAGERLVTTPVSIDNSVISVGFEITNHF